MGENSGTGLIRIGKQSFIPGEMTIKFKGSYEFSVFHDLLLIDDSRYGDLYPMEKMMFCSIIKDMYLDIAKKLVDDKKGYKLKLKAHQQAAVYMVCMRETDGLPEYERVVIRDILSQIHQNFLNHG